MRGTVKKIIKYLKAGEIGAIMELKFDFSPEETKWMKRELREALHGHLKSNRLAQAMDVAMFATKAGIKIPKGKVKSNIGLDVIKYRDVQIMKEQQMKTSSKEPLVSGADMKRVPGGILYHYGDEEVSVCTPDEIICMVRVPTRIYTELFGKDLESLNLRNLLERIRYHEDEHMAIMPAHNFMGRVGDLSRASDLRDFMDKMKEMKLVENMNLEEFAERAKKWEAGSSLVSEMHSLEIMPFGTVTARELLKARRELKDHVKA